MEGKPATPELRRCKLCNADIYRVTSAFGELVEVDAVPLSVVTANVIGNSGAVERAVWRHKLLREAGGHVILEPTFFLGWRDDREAERGSPRSGVHHKPGWQFFSRRLSLSDAIGSGIAVHAEHHETCEGVSLKRLCHLLSSAAVTALKEHTEQRKRTRRLNMSRRQECAVEQLQAEQSASTAASRTSIDHHPSQVSAQQQRQLTLF